MGRGAWGVGAEQDAAAPGWEGRQAPQEQATLLCTHPRICRKLRGEFGRVALVPYRSLPPPLLQLQQLLRLHQLSLIHLWAARE